VSDRIWSLTDIGALLEEVHERLGYGWRFAVVAWAGLSAVAGLAALVLTQFDSQYDEAGVAGRLLAGVGVGLLTMAIYSPVTLIAAALVGLGAGVAHRRRLADSN